MKDFRRFITEHEATFHSLQDDMSETPPEGGAEAYPNWLKARGITYREIVSVDKRDTIYVFRLGHDRFVLEDGDDKIWEASDWLDGRDAENWIEIPDFNQEFWKYPGSLYHATQESNKESILKKGILPKNTTRGMNNKFVGAAVFTVDDWTILEGGSYGSLIFQINCRAMKSDGYTPHVEREPIVAEHEARSALAHRLDLDQQWDGYDEAGTGEWEQTVIVYGKIPPKYLSIVGED